MERKKRKYSVDEKVNLAKIVAKHKDEYDNFESFFFFVFVFNEYFYRIAIQKLYTYLQIYIKFLLFYGSCESTLPWPPPPILVIRFCLT